LLNGLTSLTFTAPEILKLSKKKLLPPAFLKYNLNLTLGSPANEAKLTIALPQSEHQINESASLKFNLIKTVDNLSVIIRDVLGKDVTKIISNTSFSAGQYTLDIDRNKNLSSGLYFIEFNADDNIQVEKLIIE